MKNLTPLLKQLAVITGLFTLCFMLPACSAWNKALAPSAHIAPQPIQPCQQQDPQFSRISKIRRHIVQTSIENIGTPYVWGGTRPEMGFDCSGLVYYVYRSAGIPVPRTARDQYNTGSKVNKNNLKPGDLVFFNISRRTSRVHVGIFTGNNEFIHAPGKGKPIRVASLDNVYFKHTFLGGRTFIQAR